MKRRGHLYILRCADGSYYVGSSNNLELRVGRHVAGEGSQYTAKRLPLKLVYSCEVPTLFDAFLLKRQIKGWSRKKKEALIRGDYASLVELSKSRSGQSGE